ncbi:MAG: protoporphyrinogen oxidase [Caldilineae bacterium]|nr:MAG: protoporphyrinogen oxidase [Caldilineae bacterium]
MTQEPQVRRVIIIGGGMAGMATAYYLEKEAKQRGLLLRYTLLEAGSRLGGKMLTEYVDGFTIEAGPDSFITQKPAALDLALELGLEDSLIPTNEENKGVYVYHGGRLKALPEGVMLIVPTKVAPFVLSSLFTPWGKLRMGMDLVLPPRRDDGDETLAEFIRRRLGEEALDRLAEPLMSGIYNAEAEHQSIMATFPRFRAMEKRHGSLIRGMLAARKQPRRAGNGRTRARTVFMSLRGGVGELAARLGAALSGEVRLQAEARRVWREGAGYKVALKEGEVLEADAVVVATPAQAAAALLEDVRSDLSAALRRLRTVSTGTVSLAYRQQDFPRGLKGFGFVIPRSARRRINAVTWSSLKWSYRAPDGYVLLRVFFGGSRHPEVFALDDDRLLALVQSELAVTMGLAAKPVLSRIYRWPNASPQYDVGHLERVAALEAACPAGLYLTGSPYRGVGLPDCVQQGRETAVRVMAELWPARGR